MKYISLTLSLVAVLTASFIAVKTSEDAPVPPVKTITQINSGTDFISAKSWPLPENIDFCGEAAPLEKTHVRELLDRELLINTYWLNNTILLLKNGNRWLGQISEILSANGIPDDFKYVAVIESRLMNEVSPSGAVGFWQFMKPTAEEYGLEINNEVDERYHPIKSTIAATQYLKNSYRKFGNWTNVAASYNRGMSGFNKSMETQGMENYYDVYQGEEGSRYVYRILATKEIFSNPEKYGIYVSKEHMYPVEAVKQVVVTESIPELKTWAKDQGINYLLLKRHNPWLRSDKLTVAQGRSYEIAIPVNP